MSKAQDAFNAAEAGIKHAMATGEDTLDFSGEVFHALEELPAAISEYTGLQSLDLDSTGVTDLTPISGLIGLQTLRLDSTGVTNLAPLHDLIGLQVLDLDNTKVADLAPISGCTGLIVLRLNNSGVADLSLLRDLKRLKTLSLTSTGVTDLEPISGLTRLQTLYLDSTEVTNLAPISGCTGLQTLLLDNSQVADLRPIQYFTELAKDANSKLWNGLHFKNTPAARSSPEMTRLSEIKDDETRTREMLAYLKTLRSNEKIPDRKDIASLKRSVKSLQTDLDGKTDLLADASSQIDTLTKALTAARDRLESFETDTKKRIEDATKNYRASMNAAEAAFREDQAISEPVALWKEKQNEHETSRDWAFKLFVGGLVVIGLTIICLVVAISKNAETINALMAPVGCDLTNPETCKGFSYRGLIVVAGTLTFFTVMLWFTRLQMKLYLAERHLVLDARERRAFAQVYIGFLKEGDTSEEAKEQRALVYSALFRPSSDGTVKEDGGLDPAITAALSKWLSK